MRVYSNWVDGPNCLADDHGGLKVRCFIKDGDDRRRTFGIEYAPIDDRTWTKEERAGFIWKQVQEMLAAAKLPIQLEAAVAKQENASGLNPDHMRVSPAAPCNSVVCIGNP